MGIEGASHAELRAAVLRALYSAPGAKNGEAVGATSVASTLGLDPVTMDRILDGLVVRRLVTRLISDDLIRLTEHGVDSVEGTSDSSAQPNGTSVVINAVGGVQVNPMNSPQQVNLSFADDLRPVIADLRAAIAGLHIALQDRERLDHMVAAIDHELSSPTPRPDAAARALKSIRGILRGTAEATAGAALAPEAVKVMELLEHALRLLPH